jgi:hypothetical protein
MAAFGFARRLGFAHGLVAAGVFGVAGFATPSFALVHLQQHSGGWHPVAPMGGWHQMKPPHQGQSGCGCGSSQGGNYGGGHRMVWIGGHAPLGYHPKGLHYYGMGGSGWHAGYGMGYGKSYGYSHEGMGQHRLGMHYYGLEGGSLAAHYGRLIRPLDVDIRIRVVSVQERVSRANYKFYGSHKAGWGKKVAWGGQPSYQPPSSGYQPPSSGQWGGSMPPPYHPAAGGGQSW